VEELCASGVTAWRGAPLASSAASRRPHILPPWGRSGSLSRRPGPAGFVRSPSSTSPPIPRSASSRRRSATRVAAHPSGTFSRSCSTFTPPTPRSGRSGRRRPGSARPHGAASAPARNQTPFLPLSRAAGGRASRPRAANRPSAKPQGVTPPSGPHHSRNPPLQGAEGPPVKAGGAGREREKRGLVSGPGRWLASPPSGAVCWVRRALERVDRWCSLRCCQPPSPCPRPIPRRANCRGSPSSSSACSLLLFRRWGIKA
jgi:hypothetical protein